MALFGKKTSDQKRCPECRYFVIVKSKGFCSREIPASVNVRLLSEEGIKRQCAPCPPEMTCPSWQAK